MKKLFFLYVWLNLTRPECFRDKEDLVKHIRKRTIQTGRLFFSSSLITCFSHECTNFFTNLLIQCLRQIMNYEF